MIKTQEGFLLIADITGYTLYLSKSELDHAQGILSALLELLVQRTRPPLIISRLAGDAVISYGLRNQFIQGQTFMEMIEDTYVAFRKAIEQMILNNTCRCNACANIAALDLKFFVHYGEFAIQHIGDHDELVGSDVNLIHRLLKNTVTEATGMRAYTFYTDPAIQALSIQAVSSLLTSHRETYEHLGEIQGWVQNMHDVWYEKKNKTRITLSPDETLISIESEFAMTPELLWDYLVEPKFRNTLMASDKHEIINRSNGRVVPGSVFQCYHGDKVMAQTILEWQPFERLVTLCAMPVRDTSILMEFLLEPTERGTVLKVSFSKCRGPVLGRKAGNLMLKLMTKDMVKSLRAFQNQIEADLAERKVGEPVI
jgi:hypothetical protein